VAISLSRFVNIEKFRATAVEHSPQQHNPQNLFLPTTPQLQALQLCLDSKPESAPFVRVDLSISNGFDVIQWSNNDSLVASPVFAAVEVEQSENQSQKVEGEEGEEGEQSTKQEYTVDFGNLLVRSTALDLNNVVMNGLVGARVVSLCINAVNHS
jgi:hypothetical protein